MSAPTADEADDYVTPSYVAAMVKLSPKSIYRLAANDPTMPAIRLGGSLRFPRKRLLAWLRAREQGAGRPRRLSVVGTDAGAGTREAAR
jgi:predicted DNA-binding transcriptional regulator AlpA